MKVLLRSNPTAMISLAFCRANAFVCSTLSSCLNKNFSSSVQAEISEVKTKFLRDMVNVLPVNWMTRGTSNTSCNHLQIVSEDASGDEGTHLVKTKGIMCPKCILSLLGPLPVYRKNGFPCS